MNDGAIYNEEDNDATQPVSSPGYSSTSQDNRLDKVNNNDDGDEMTKSSINETPTVTETSKEDYTAVIDISYQKNRVTWNDASEQLCQMEDVSFDLYLNTSANTAMFKLHAVTKFIVHLDSSNAILSKADFDLLEKTFSGDRPEGRPRTDLPRSNPATLYAGHGGEIAEKNELMHTAESPPPYAGSAPNAQSSKKRRRADYSDEDSSGVARVLVLLKDVVCRLDNIESRIESRFDDMENRVSGLEQYIKDNLRDVLDNGRSPCRYGTEERQEIFEEMNNQIDDYAMDLKWTYQDTINELEKESGRILTQVTEDLKEEVRQSSDDALDNFDRTIDDRVKEKLKSATIRFDGTFGLEF
ncbi:hypothetical protein ACHAPE_006256 [Trichoderma viride]